MTDKLLMMILMLITLNISAQTKSTNTKPSWLDDVGKPLSDYYDYYIGFGENSNMQKAREKTLDDVYNQISDEIKATYKTTQFSKTEIRNLNQNGNVNTTTDFEFVGTVEKTGEKVTVSGIKEVEYYWIQNNGTYQYWTLIRKPKTNTKDSKLPLYKFDNSCIWRSAIYSGWGQMYNRQKGKGLALLCGETVGLAGIIVGQLMYSNNIDQANKTTNQNRKVYLDNANTWTTIRNMSAIAAGAIYLYNLIDIATSSKPKIYSYNSPKHFELYPDINKNYCQLTLKITLK